MATAEKKSVLEQIRGLKEQQEKLLEAAKAEALETAQKAIAELNDLGFSYRLTQGQEGGRNTKPAAPKRQQKDAPCPICGFKTDPLHDGRAHRSQKVKKAFTPAELAERDMTKVG